MSKLRLKQTDDFNVSNSQDKQVLRYNASSGKFENSDVSELVDEVTVYLTGAQSGGSSVTGKDANDNSIDYVGYSYNNSLSNIVLEINNDYLLSSGEDSIILLTINGIDVAPSSISVMRMGMLGNFTDRITINPLLYTIESDDVILLKYTMV